MRTMIAVSLAGLAGCGGKAREEMQAALDEAVRSNRAEVLAAELIERSSDFTLGEAEENAASSIRAWYQAEVPCAATSVSGTTVEIDFGAVADGCTYDGHPWAGLLVVTVAQNDLDQARLTHSWEELSNGVVAVTGGGTVSWTSAGGARAVEHHVAWTDLATDEVVPANGERSQARLDPLAGWDAGVVVDGLRDWSTEAGLWTFVSDGIELQGQDPVPQAGSGVLTTPGGEVYTFGFERLDAGTVEVTVESGAGHRRLELDSTWA